MIKETKKSLTKLIFFRKSWKMLDFYFNICYYIRAFKCDL